MVKKSFPRTATYAIDVKPLSTTMWYSERERMLCAMTLTNLSGICFVRVDIWLLTDIYPDMK